MREWAIVGRSSSSLEVSEMFLRGRDTETEGEVAVKRLKNAHCELDSGFHEVFTDDDLFGWYPHL
jgi:guanylate kinase